MHVAVITTLTIKVIKEAGVGLAADRIRVEHKIQEDSNNGTQTSILKIKVSKVATNTVKITYNPVQQRIKIVRNVPSEVNLRKFFVPLMLTTWEIDRENNKKKLRQKVSKPKTILCHSLNYGHC